MKDIGLTEKELSLIVSNFNHHPEIENVFLFGSRAKGTAKINSDIDLAVNGTCNVLQIESLALELDELPLPYKFDVKSLSEISNIALHEHICRVGILLYTRKENGKGKTCLPGGSCSFRR